MQSLIGESGVLVTLCKGDQITIKDLKFASWVDEGFDSTKKALYKTMDESNIVFVKFSENYKKIKKEYDNQKIFFELSKHDHKSKVYIPKPIGLENLNGVFAFIMEFVKNTKIHDIDDTKKVEIYLEILRFLHKQNANSRLRKLTSYYQICTIPYFYIKNILTFPSYTLLFTKALIKVLRFSRAWILLEHKTLSQGDLNVSNILLAENKLVFIDFTEACITHKYFNIAQALNSSWKDKVFQDALYEDVIKEFKLDMKEKKILKSFVLFNLMQRLCQRYKFHEQELVYLNKMKLLANTL